MMGIEVIKAGDNSAIEQVIKTVLEEHGVNKPGTAYFDDSLKNMQGFYSVPKSVYFIARIDGEIVGGSGIFPTQGLPSDTCELVKMYLLPKARGRGLGRQLIDRCIEFAATNGYKKVYLETMAELSNAIGMYEKSGFHLLKGPLGNTGHFACTIRMLKEI
jgi:putative acetyltransferase